MSELNVDKFINAAKDINDYQAAIELILKAVDSPFVYAFSDLLESPLISAVT